MSSTTTSSTAAAHNGTEHAHHHGGPLDKLKGVFANRPSSRDRHGDREVSLDRTTTGGTAHTDATATTERGRGRHVDGDFLVSTGRGGAGNIRASSKTRAPDTVEPGAEEARERSRERSRERGFGVVGGRGGAGNFRSASRAPEDRIKEEREHEEAKEQERIAHEKRAVGDANHLKSHGRGGAGNISK